MIAADSNSQSARHHPRSCAHRNGVGRTSDPRPTPRFTASASQHETGTEATPRLAGGRVGAPIHTPGDSDPPFPPTARQLELLRYIAGYQEAHAGRTPMLIECAAALGNRRGNVFSLLTALAARGLIHRAGDRFRTITLRMRPPVPRAPDGAPLFFVPLHAAEVDHG